VVLGGEYADSEHRGAAHLLQCAVVSPMAHGSCKRLDGRALVDAYVVRRPNRDGVVTG
jgi:hypothetical protein